MEKLEKNDDRQEVNIMNIISYLALKVFKQSYVTLFGLSNIFDNI
jgi:hypothetical protein